MKSVSIHQPCYLPYLGIIYKIWRSDIFVYLDDVQYRVYVLTGNKIVMVMCLNGTELRRRRENAD